MQVKSKGETGSQSKAAGSQGDVCWLGQGVALSTSGVRTSVMHLSDTTEERAYRTSNEQETGQATGKA